MTAYSMDEKVKDIQRAQYWHSQGYGFDPNTMTAYSMDEKVKDIQRARYWRTRGYDFDPNTMTAYSMDEKAKDIERAKSWRAQGYNFDPNTMTAYSMDEKVKDIERANYWRSRGYNFDPNVMTAYSMDEMARNTRPSRLVSESRRAPSTQPDGLPVATQAVASPQGMSDVERAMYWKQRGYDFDPNQMGAAQMDRLAHNIERARYWKATGFSFDPYVISADQMDQRVKAIKRAEFWRQHGYEFDPEVMNADVMDDVAKEQGVALEIVLAPSSDVPAKTISLEDVQSGFSKESLDAPGASGERDQAKDTQRAEFWRNYGYEFDPEHMSAAEMDEVARQQGISVEGTAKKKPAGDKFVRQDRRSIPGTIAPLQQPKEILSPSSLPDYVHPLLQPEAKSK
jgi:protein required for attachment to host cells